MNVAQRSPPKTPINRLVRDGCGPCNGLTPDVEHKSRTLLQQLQLSGTFYLRRPTFRLSKNLGEDVLDGFGHALCVATNIYVAFAVENGIGDISTVVPKHVLDIDLAAVRLVRRLTGECTVKCEFALEFLRILRPFFLIEEVFRRFTAAVKE